MKVKAKKTKVVGRFNHTHGVKHPDVDAARESPATRATASDENRSKRKPLAQRMYPSHE